MKYLKFIVVLLILISCKKEVPNYLNNYVGNWKFEVIKISFNTDSIGSNSRDSLIYDGTIAFGKSDNQILIKYTAEDSVYLTIDEAGILSDFPTTHSGGEFESFDKLHMVFQWGGLGGGIRHFINGEKRK